MTGESNNTYFMRGCSTFIVFQVHSFYLDPLASPKLFVVLYFLTWRAWPSSGSLYVCTAVFLLGIARGVSTLLYPSGILLV